MNAAQTAETIIQTLGASIYRQYAVILSQEKDAVTMIGTDTRTLERLIDTNPSCVVGVYDINARYDDVVDDMIYAGMVP
jgi:short-subunit dehydrogenase involved in D-alanine esterification of teichoic acids